MSLHKVVNLSIFGWIILSFRSFGEELPPITLPEYIVEGIEEVIKIPERKAEPEWRGTIWLPPESSPTLTLVPPLNIHNYLASVDYVEHLGKKVFSQILMGVGHFGGLSGAMEGGRAFNRWGIMGDLEGKREAILKGQSGYVGSYSSEFWIWKDLNQADRLVGKGFYQHHTYRRPDSTFQIHNLTNYDVGISLSCLKTVNLLGLHRGERVQLLSNDTSTLKPQASLMNNAFFPDKETTPYQVIMIRGFGAYYQPYDGNLSPRWRGDIALKISFTNSAGRFNVLSEVAGERYRSANASNSSGSKLQRETLLGNISGEWSPEILWLIGKLEFGGHLYSKEDSLSSKTKPLLSFKYSIKDPWDGVWNLQWKPQWRMMFFKDIEENMPYVHYDKGGIVIEDRYNLHLAYQRPILKGFSIEVNSHWVESLHKPFPSRVSVFDIAGQKISTNRWELSLRKAEIWENRLTIKKESLSSFNIRLTGIWRQAQTFGGLGKRAPLVPQQEAHFSIAHSFYPYIFKGEIVGYWKIPWGFTDDEGEIPPYIGSGFDVVRDTGRKWWWQLGFRNIFNRPNRLPIDSPPFSFTLQVSYRML